MDCTESMQRHRKWCFAGKLARQSDGRFARQVLEYIPNIGFGRGAGRPRLRWADEIENFAGGSWLKIAEDEELWAAAEGLFTTTYFFQGFLSPVAFLAWASTLQWIAHRTSHILVEKCVFWIPRRKTMQSHYEITSKTKFWNRNV